MNENKSNPKLIVYFDGACPLCRREIDFYRGRSEDVSFVDVSRARDPEALGAGLCPSDALKRFHVRTPDGELKDGAAAFAALWSHTPSVAWLGRIFAGQPALAIAEGAYRGFLTVRPVMQSIARWLEKSRSVVRAR
ncbi:MAG: DUF393 domain-containing protein [Pseudomonadota bacterium]